MVPGHGVWRFSEGTADALESGRPRPLYTVTATQLGIVPSAGVPTMADMMLPGPRDCPAACRHWVVEQLFTPPPYASARRIRRAVEELTTTDRAVPKTLAISAPRNAHLTARVRMSQAHSRLVHAKPWVQLHLCGMQLLS